MRPFTLLVFALFSMSTFAQTPLYLQPGAPLDDRISDLISRMTLEQKVSLLNFESAAIPELGIPAYNWWGEALHGVARHGRATVFPQAISLAATWDTALIYRVASAISDEARAKYQASVRLGNQGLRYTGLTFWSPNINIFRDPRWGRGQETYGEDPFLSGSIGVAFVKGMQGNHPVYLKTAACAKHFVIHSGPEGLRHSFNAEPSLKDFRETYLPAFKMLVQEGNVEAVMCAYNRIYGEPCCGNPIMNKILREEWGFKGHFVSDCWAISDFHGGHGVTASPQASAALAFRNGVDVNCGNESPYLVQAVKEGLISEDEIDVSLRRNLRTRFRLGFFDPEGLNPYTKIGPEVLHSEAHRQLALEAAEKSMVLLKNNGTLPLQKDLKRLYVYGPTAANQDALLGNYFGVSSQMTTFLEGITGAIDPGTNMEYKHAILLDRPNVNPTDWVTGDAQSADAVIVVLGLTGLLEGEEGEALSSEHMSDRADIDLPAHQKAFLKKLRAACTKPIVVVLTGGSPMAIPEVTEWADALIYAGYSGEAGGEAAARLIFGDANPSGRLPFTWPMSVSQLPDYASYDMQGRTYRYMTQEPLFPFGFGLSYTRFEYGAVQFSKSRIKTGETVTVTVQVKNTGTLPGEEVVQCYLTDVKASVRTPLASLKGFTRVHLAPGQSATVRFELTPEMMGLVIESGTTVLEPGDFRVTVGGASPSARVTKLGGAAAVSGEFVVENR